MEIEKNLITSVLLNRYGIKVKQILDVTPIPAPRMTRSDKWKTNPTHSDPRKRQRKSVNRYFAFRNAIDVYRNLGLTLNQELNICFVLPMPKSYSKKKRAELYGQYHELTPDRDNLLKAYQDAFSDNDGFVADGRTIKIWGNVGYIILF